MNSSQRTAMRSVIATAAAAVLVAGGAIANAQMPGGDTDGVVVKTDGSDLVVTVDDKVEDPTAVTGTIENASDDAYRCATPGMELEGENPGQVTTAGVANLALDYYATNVFTGEDGFDVPMAGPVGFGSLMDLIPAGSAVGSAEVDTRTAQQDARVAGHTGDPEVDGAVAFDVAAGETVDWSAQLGVPATGDRGQWQSAALFYCVNQATDEPHVFAGFEEVEDDNSGGGSLPSGSLGS